MRFQISASIRGNRKHSQEIFESEGNRKQAIGSSDTNAQGIVEKKMGPGLAIS
jgi:hypothetical protein